MIPLFTPATARKEVNKHPGDSELAKLANLNRLVENVNTIVAQGIPAASPAITFSTVGNINTLRANVLTQISPADFSSTGGTNIAQSQTLAYIYGGADMFGNTATETISSITFPEITLLGSIELNGYLNLTTVNLPSLVTIKGDFIFYDLESLTSINAPNLVSAGGQDRRITNANSLESLSLPSFTSELVINNAPALTSVVLSDTVFDLIVSSAPLLTTVSSGASKVTVDMYETGITDLTSTNFPNVTDLTLLGYKGTTLSFPLVTAFTLRIFDDISTLTINLPSVTNIYNFVIENTSLTSITIPPTVVNFNGDLVIQNNLLLTSLSLGVIGTLKKIDASAIALPDNALDEASINGILALLVSLDGTNGTTLWGPSYTVSLYGGANSAPTGQGLIDKQTLIDRGANVETN